MLKGFLGVLDRNVEKKIIQNVSIGLNLVILLQLIFTLNH